MTGSQLRTTDVCHNLFTADQVGIYMKPLQYPFRLNHEDLTAAVFTAGQNNFRCQLNRAFISLITEHKARSASLEVQHKVHGWQKVYSNAGVSQRVDNPLLLDYLQLYDAAIYTLRCCDTWPTEEEKQRIKEELRKKERHQQSLAMRETFYVVQED